VNTDKAQPSVEDTGGGRSQSVRTEICVAERKCPCRRYRQTGLFFVVAYSRRQALARTFGWRCHSLRQIASGRLVAVSRGRRMAGHGRPGRKVAAY
jgi:hypothetical protein